MEFRPARKLSVVTDIVDQVKDMIRDHRFGPGTKLPSERELCKKLGVSRASVREALRTLALVGVIDTRQGLGTQLTVSTENIFRAPLEFLILLDELPIAELHQTRELIEVHLAGLAARHRTAEDLAAMEAALREMRDHLSDPAAVTEPDVRFHEAIAAAAHQRLLERFMSCLRESLHRLIAAAWPAVRSMEASLQLHEQIFDAIRRQDEEAAREATRRNLAEAADELRRVGAIR